MNPYIYGQQSYSPPGQGWVQTGQWASNYGGDEPTTQTSSVSADVSPTSRVTMSPKSLTPNANPWMNIPRRRPQNLNLQNLTVDVDVGTARSTQYAEADRNVLMLLASQRQCDQSSNWSGKGWLYAFIIIIIIVIIVWIIIAVCQNNKNKNNCCHKCGQSHANCQCVVITTSTTAPCTKKKKKKKCSPPPPPCSSSSDSDQSSVSESCSDKQGHRSNDHGGDDDDDD